MALRLVSCGDAIRAEVVLEGELREVMVSEHLHLSAMLPGDAAEDVQALSPERVVIGTLGRQDGHRVVVGRQFHPQVVGVADVQQPAVPIANRDTAVSQRMTEQRDEICLGSKGEFQPTGFRPEPSLRRGSVSDPCRPVIELGR